MDRHHLHERLRRLRDMRNTGEQEIRVLLKYGTYGAVRTGRSLYYQGDISDKAYLILSGLVKIVKYRSDESSLVIGNATEGDWLGVAELILSAPYLNDAVVQASTEVIEYTVHNFMQLSKLEYFRRFFYRQLAKNVYFLHSRIELNLPICRLTRYITENCLLKGNEYVLYATQEELSRVVGVTRETINKYLGQLQTEGLVSVGRGIVRIADREALAQYAG